MARVPDPKVETARAMYQEGKPLVEIAKALDVPPGTVRRWKSTYRWDSERSIKESERSDRNNERSEKKANVRKVKKSAAREAVGQAMVHPELTDQQQLFCIFRAFGDSATTAYQKAYKCSYQTAMAAGSRLLRNVKVRDEVNRLKKERMETQLFNEHDIFQWYLDVAMANITDFVAFGREQVPVMGPFGPVVNKKTGEPVMKEVNYVKFKESSEVNGHVIKKVKMGKDGASIELYDAAAAMNWLADHMGLGTSAQQTLAQSIMEAYEKRKQAQDSEGGESNAESE